MGNLLKVLTREIENYPHFFLDFESKSGTGVERMEKGWMEEKEGFLISRILLVMEPLWTLLQLFFISAAPFCFDYLIIHTSSFLPPFFLFSLLQKPNGESVKIAHLHRARTRAKLFP